MVLIILFITCQLQQAREQEMQASQEAIHRLQEEEQRLVRSLEYQALQDEELARKIAAEEKEQVISFQNRYFWIIGVKIFTCLDVQPR